MREKNKGERKEGRGGIGGEAEGQRRAYKNLYLGVSEQRT